MISPSLVRRYIRSLGVHDLLVAQFYPILSSIVVTFATAALLGPSGRGDLAHATATATLGGAVTFASLHVGASDLHVRGLPGLKSAVRLSLIVQALTAAIGAAIALFSSHPTTILLITIGVCFVSLNLFVLRSIQALGDNRNFRRSWAIQSAGYALIALPLAHLSHDWITVYCCWLASLVASTLYSARAFWARASIEKRPEASTYAQTIRSSSMAHAGTISMQLLYRADIVILGIYASSSAVGFYSIASTSIGFIWNISEAFSLRAFQRDGERTDAAQSDRKLLRASLILSIICAILIYGSAALFIPLLLPSYTPSLPLMLILAVGVVCQGPARIALSSLQRDRHYSTAMRLGWTAAFLAIFYFPAALTWGAYGVAWTSTITYVIMALLTTSAWRRSTIESGTTDSGQGASRATAATEEKSDV